MGSEQAAETAVHVAAGERAPPVLQRGGWHVIRSMTLAMSDDLAAPSGAAELRLLDQVRDAIRLRH